MLIESLKFAHWDIARHNKNLQDYVYHRFNPVRDTPSSQGIILLTWKSWRKAHWNHHIYNLPDWWTIKQTANYATPFKIYPESDEAIKNPRQYFLKLGGQI